MLPKSYPRSKAFYEELYQDAMYMVRKMGLPDLFITFTTNPEWDQIKKNLAPGQRPIDRPDLIAKVFQAKFQSFMKEIT